jgi:hypothetical protein
MRRAWKFLQAEKNREILAWLGGGVVVVVSGLFAAVTLLWSPDAPSSPSKPSMDIEASQGGVAVGRDVTNSTITGGAGPPPASTPAR